MVHWYFDEKVAAERMRETKRQAIGPRPWACFAGRHQWRGFGFKGGWAIG